MRKTFTVFGGLVFVLLAMCLPISGLFAADANAKYTAAQQSNILRSQSAVKESVQFMTDPDRGYYPVSGLTFGANMGEWTAVAIGRSYFPADQEIWELYERNFTAAVNGILQDSATLDTAKSMVHSRAIVGLAALNLDPVSVDGHDLTAALADMDFVEKQGIYGPIWALLALDAADLPNPSQAVTRDTLIEKILDNELEDGGWALSGSSIDLEVTGSAITALAPYYNDSAYPAVKTAVDKALLLADLLQAEDGDFISWGTANCDSTAWMLISLCALGIDPCQYTVSNKPLFISDTGKTMVDGLLKYHLGNAGFVYKYDSGDYQKSNPASTEKATYALDAYLRYVTGQTALFDYSDAGAVYQVRVDSALKNGTIEVAYPDPEAMGAKQGQDITLTVKGADTNGDGIPDYELKNGSLTYRLEQGNISFDNDGKLILAKQYGDARIPIRLPQSFAMPQANILVTAEFVPAGSQEPFLSHEITLGSFENGTIMLGANTARPGETVRFKLTANSGYIYKAGSLQVKGAVSGGNIKYRVSAESGIMKFDMPNEPVVISAVFEKSPTVGKATICIEKFTLGQGYMIEPQIVDIYEGDTVAMLLGRILEKDGRTMSHWGTLDSGFYVASISDPDYQYVDIEVPSYLSSFPTSLTRTKPSLGEFDYDNMSGWMYSVNNWFPNYGAADYRTDTDAPFLKMEDGDIIRWQFTVHGYGMDIGGGFEGDATSGSFEGTYITLAPRSAATLTLAQINTYYSSYKEDQYAAYDNAIAVMSDLEATEEELTAAMAPLEQFLANKQQEFGITVDKRTIVNGYAIDTPISANAGDTVTVKVSVPSGKPTGFMANGVAMKKIDAETYRFVMPAKNTMITVGETTAEDLTPQELCDLNGNHLIDADDLTALLLKFGEAAADGERGDTNKSGVIDADDVTTLLYYFATEL